MQEHFSKFTFLKFHISQFAFPNQIRPFRPWRPLREQSPREQFAFAGRIRAYLNVPTAFVFVVGSTTQTATELGTLEFVKVRETDFGFT